MNPPVFHRVLLVGIANLVFVFSACTTNAQSLRICCYNVLDGPVTPADDQDFRVVIEAIGNQSVLGNAQPIDILAFQEGPQDANQYNDIEDNFEAVFGSTFDSSFTSPDFAGCRTGFIFNTATVQLIAGSTLSSGLTHNVRRGHFRPVGGTSDDDFYIYSIHLKAGTFDPADAAIRENEANVLRNNAATLPSDAQIIYCGDFNMAGSDEDAFQVLFNGDTTGSARETLNAPFGFRDNTNWQENNAFLPFHTQNPVNNMDDRFDLFFINNNMRDGVNTEYVRGSCTVLGNNSTHNLNQSINTGTGTTGFSSEIVATSDHLPVFCDFRWGQAAPQFNQVVSVDAVSTNFVRPNGPVAGASGTNDMEVEGSFNGNFASFGVIDFDLSGQLAAGSGVALTDNVVLTMIQDNEFFTDSGPYSVYVTTAAAAIVPIDASIQYQSGQNGIDCVPVILATGAQKVATYAGVHEAGGGNLPDGTIDNVALYGPDIESAFAVALESKGTLRLLLVPEIGGTAVTFTGFTSALGSPSLSADIIADDGSVDVLPSSITLENGTQGSGIIGGTDASDDLRIEYFAAPVSDPSTPNIHILFTGVLPTATPQSLNLVVESRVNSPNLQLVTEQFNFSTGIWEQIDTAKTLMDDTTNSFTVSGNLSDYVAPGNLILSRVGWIPAGPVLLFPWKSENRLI